MSISRRGFLQAILAAAVAPAIVKAANLMKVVQISNTGIVGLDNGGKIPEPLLHEFDGTSDYLMRGASVLNFGDKDFTIEMWGKLPSHSTQGFKHLLADDEWHHVAVARSSEVTRYYVDRKEVMRHVVAPFAGAIKATSHNGRNFLEICKDTPTPMLVSELRITDGYARAMDEMSANIPSEHRAMKLDGCSHLVASLGPSCATSSVSRAVQTALNSSADQLLGSAKTQLFGTVLNDARNLCLASANLVDQWERPLITLPFEHSTFPKEQS